MSHYGLELRVGHVLDVRVPGVEPVHDPLVDVEAEHPVAGVGQLDRERQPDIAQAHDAEEHLPALGLGDEVLCHAHHAISIGGIRPAHA